MKDMNGEVIDNMENLILIYESKKYFFNTFEEIVEVFFGKQYESLSFNEKFKIRYQKALGFCMKNNIELVDTRVGHLGGNGEILSKEFDFEKAFIIDNEKTYILSMCKFENILLLENKASKIFNIEGVAEVEDIEDNYIVVNKIIDKLLLLNMKL